MRVFYANQFTTTNKALTTATLSMTTPTMTHTKNSLTEHLYDQEQSIKNKKSLQHQHQQQQQQSSHQTNVSTHNDNLIVNAQQQKQKMHQQNAAFGNTQKTTIPPPAPQQQAQTEVQYNHQHLYGNKPHENLPTNYIQSQPAPPPSTASSTISPTTSTHQPQLSPTKTLPATHRNDVGIQNNQPNSIYSRPDEIHQQQQQQQQQKLPIAFSPKNKQKNITVPECFQNQTVYHPQTKSTLENNIHETKSAGILVHGGFCAS